MKQQPSNTKSLTALCLLGSALLLNIATTSTASAGIFKCTNKAGKIYYNDKPCPINQKEKKIRAEKDPANGYVPKIPTVASESSQDPSKNKVVKKDDFGTPQYKGKESERQHDARVKFEANMEKRAEVEKEARMALALKIEELKSAGETDKAELLTRVLQER